VNKGILLNMFAKESFTGTNCLNVSELTRYLRQLMESDDVLRDVWVQGEISNLARPASGHIYFTLKDANAALRCVVWRSNANRLKNAFQDGMAVEVHGNINIYETGGLYQLYADNIRPKGEGVLYQEFVRLKTLLEGEGLFDSGRKRAIPQGANRIGIVTSPTGAALQDMLNTLRRRNPMVEVILAATAVQGEEAPLGIKMAMERLNQYARPDLILLVRGGGSIEDLWSFNDERVVRAIVNSEAPVITGVGHETDFTLADFAADVRAPTPTAAAELATPISIADMKAQLVDTSSLLVNLTLAVQDQFRNLIKDYQVKLHNCSPERRIQSAWQSLDDSNRRMISAQRHRLSLETTRLSGLGDHLSSLNPMDVLKRGYAFVTRKSDQKLISQTRQVFAGDQLSVQVQDGSFAVQVSSIE
jgi:exodeoxyribonuclease VII large subunit